MSDPGALRCCTTFYVVDFAILFVIPEGLSYHMSLSSLAPPVTGCQFHEITYDPVLRKIPKNQLEVEDLMVVALRPKLRPRAGAVPERCPK